MKRKIFYIVRYSVLQHSKAWNIAKENDFNTYKEILFSNSRLHSKYELFKAFTIQSLQKQEKADVEYETEVIVLTSDELPQPHLSKLMMLKDEIPLTILEIGATESMFSALSNYIARSFSSETDNFLYATVRIDDDDMLSKNYESRLLSYITPENKDYIVSFPIGIESYVVIPEEGSPKLEYSIEIDFPKIALGLAHIGFYNATHKRVETKKAHVYLTGAHTTVDERFTLIYDMTPRAYIRIAYDEQDTQARGIKKRLSKSKLIDSQELLNEFPSTANF
tara:strand:+ start:5239 stop:6075 length:837 start_codon:yes stop_codon:yes gene_type:complete